MGENKKIIKIIVSIILLIIINLSCSPIKRHARLVKKYPFVHQTDTVVLRDTINIYTPIVQSDTIMLLDSSLISLHDTITIQKENLIVKIAQIHDSIYIDAKCDTIYIDKIIERKIPVKYYETKKESDWKYHLKYFLYLLFILLFLIIIIKFIQFIKS